ncbi:oxygen-independent coproporphyrinogen III oxidase [Ovoidimarina sediminis]|uniref:oxygen-independent coproporphyrinogen III oxidase n=1 Tax=Ovoidimarina sediminis TaxID=3079856 RepID=UPI00290DBDE3|nr:oxygen-independent coproporphyrinogen III oxidase [Rhodophyticola sp. MJ-SS7]MDU8942096.1 oxygen-independent coproporphyrinogen III oxidase [Rhodophyticola sp. MJ-SS7]
MDPVVERYASIATPRYTSYPTAPQFQRGFSEDVYQGWLKKLNPDAPISLYIHVPFCRQMCWYCGCNMKLVKREGPLKAYVEGLLAEIALLANALPARMSVAHLHWGGGTPTALAPDDLERVMTAVRAAFDLLPDAEIAIESDPRTLTPNMIQRLAALGFTRASFGVQEFDPEVQRAINRIQPPEMVAETVDLFRRNGIDAINFDLIYGLPYQTTAKLLDTIRLVSEMAPDRIALFGYAHVPWVAKNQRMIPESALPAPRERAEQANCAALAIVDAGYEAIGIDHFAKPHDGLSVAKRSGRLRRNFQGYTDDASDTLLGVGATSIGRTPMGFIQNQPETGAWARAIEAGELPVAKGLQLQGEDTLRAAVIERIMCDGAADPDALGRNFGARPGWWADAAERLEDLAADGLVQVGDSGITLTKRGAPLARVVAAAFDSYLPAGTARHSAAL